MKTNWFKRTLCSILAFVMVLGYVPVPTFAAETDGLCAHHTQHTEACGYSPAVEGHDCGHAHTEECYQSVTECVHSHGNCGYVPPVEGHDCDCQPNENSEIVHTEGCGYEEAVAEVPCGHVCSEESGCITKVLNCQHQHDDSCGYVEGKPESPCTFVCEECAKEADQLFKEAKTDEQTEKFQITFDTSGGTILGECPESYTTGNTIVLPTDVQKAGYHFLGWYIGERCFAEIAADESGDKTFTAKWEEKATISIEKTQQAYAYDGTEKSFLLKDIAGNTLEIQSGNWVVPCGFTSILTPYGVYVSPATGEKVNHQGIDLDTGTGWPVMAARSGKIITATYSSTAGFYVKIDHGDGFTSSYLHLSNYNVAAGQEVKAGQQIGTTGATGVTSGDHLHFGIEYNGTAVNPANYISFDGDVFSVTYAPNEGLSSEGLPVEPGTYDVHIVRGETAEYKAIDDTISSALVINRKIEFNGSCGPSLRWEYDSTSKQLSISGTGKMYNYSFEDSPWRDLEILSVVFSGSITSVGSYAFNMCKGLENISLPDTVIHIGEFAFNACVDLKRVELPDSISSLNSSAFIECPSLKEILVDTGNVNFYSDSNGVLYNKEQTKLIKAPSALLGSYAIPSSVDTISDYAFFGCSGLSSIEIPDSVTNIGHTVFYYCIGLTEIHIPESVTEIGGYAFSLCEKLEKVNIPSGLTEISKNMFNGCESITEISLPDSVTRIGPNAFNACKRLAEIDIPDFVNYIDDEAFGFCENLSEIVIPWNVWEIGSGAFRQCYNLSRITFKGNAPDIAEDAFVWVTADAYYPADDGSWESDVMLDYGGKCSCTVRKQATENKR